MTDPAEPKDAAVPERADLARGPTRDLPRDLPPAAQRALAEAEARRNAEKALDLPRELGGRGGPEPVRYGDWEKDGIAHDF